MQSQISSKTLEVVQELLNAEALACRKCQVYSGYFADQELQTLVGSMSQRHSQRFNALTQYLNQQ